MRSKIFVLLFTGMLLVLGGCVHTALQPCRNLPETVSFHSDLIPVFTANCALPACHSGPAPTGNLNLEPDSAYVFLMRPGTGRVDVDHPEYSLLYNKLITNIDEMPPGGRLDTCTILLIRKWIEQGARNN